MANKALETYLNDHLAGSRLGVDLANKIVEQAQGTPLEAPMTQVATEIEEDREKLVEIMERVGATENPVKQATAWFAEKASRLKLGGITGGDDHEFEVFMSLETLALGVAGKLGLWEALEQQAGHHEGLDQAELVSLADRARSQLDVLMRERLAAAARALG